MRSLRAASRRRSNYLACPNRPLNWPAWLKVQLQSELQLAWRIVQISGTAHAPEIRLSPTGHELTIEKIPHVHAGNIGADRQ